MLADFIFSEEGFYFLRNYCKKFDAVFRIDEPSGENSVLEVNDTSYAIDKNMSIEEFKKIINQSIKKNDNLLEQQFKEFVIEYDDNLFY